MATQEDMDHATAQKTRLCFAWWNTSLSPPSKPNRASAEDRALAGDIVRQLTEVLQVHCLGLGEITTEDLDFLSAGLPSRFRTHDGTLGEAGRARFDTGVIYDRGRMEIVGDFCHTYDYALSRLKIANRITFLVDRSPELIHLLVSHWPSRLWCEQNGARRHNLGVGLREAVERLQCQSAPAPLVVLLGDYNDEPFDESLDGNLLAARDRRLVQKSGVHLYNPFWRHLGEPEPHVPGKECATFCGTCYHRRGEQTQWRTFDQIIFSSAFLGSDSWQLNETFTSVLQFEPLTSLIGSPGSIFDHFPVLSVVERTQGEPTNG